MPQSSAEGLVRVESRLCETVRKPTGNVVNRLRISLSVAFLLLLGACGGSGGGGSSMMTVPVTLSAIAVSAAENTLTAGQSQQYAANATYSDGSTKDVTSTATWASSTAAIATVAQGGVASSLATGITQISATLDSVTGMAQLTVNMPIPATWTPMGVDYGIKKQCIRTVFPTQPNFYFDEVDCPGSSYPTSKYWTTSVETENNLSGLYVGTVDQSLPINAAGSPVTETWTGTSSAGYTLELKTDYTNIANPCAPNTYTWVPLMDNWAGGGPLPAPSQLVTQFNATLKRTLPAGSGATRAMVGVGAQWNIAGANGSSVLATFEVEVNFYTDQPQWGVQAGQPPDVIAFRTDTSATPPFYYVNLDGTKLFAPISAPLGKETLITVNWAAVLQHAIDEGLLPPPINGWSNSSAATSATYAAIEVGNYVSGSNGPMADLVVSNYEEGSF
jgi:hypothetical protein